MPPTGAAIPPGIVPPGAGAKPPMAPPGNLGNAAAGLGKLGVALKALEDALPTIPMGTELHTKVLNITKDLSKELHSLQGSGEDKQAQIQALVQMARQASQQGPNQALAKMAPAPTAPVMPPAAAAA